MSTLVITWAIPSFSILLSVIALVYAAVITGNFKARNIRRLVGATALPPADSSVVTELSSEAERRAKMVLSLQVAETMMEAAVNVSPPRQTQIFEEPPVLDRRKEPTMEEILASIRRIIDGDRDVRPRDLSADDPKRQRSAG